MIHNILNNPLLASIAVLMFTALTTAVFIPSIVRIAKAKSLVSNPNGRTSHSGSIPALGGVGIFAAVGTAALLFVNTSNCTHCRFYLAGLFVIFFVGLKDDIFPLTPYKKMLGQFIAATLLVVLGGSYITDLHGFLGVSSIPVYLSIPLSIFLVLAITNSINLIDGIDGLAAGVGIIASITFGLWFLFAGHVQLGLLSLALTGSFGAFLIYNISQGSNKIFLGDTGSLILGFSISYLAIHFMELNLLPSVYQISSAPAVVVGILIVPLFDTMRVAFVRISIGKSPFSPDKLHVHHRLLFLFMSHLRATTTILIVNVLFIALSLSLQFVGLLELLALQVLIAAILSYIPVYLIGRQNYATLSLAAQKEYDKVRPQTRKHYNLQLNHKPRKRIRVLSEQEA